MKNIKYIIAVFLGLLVSQVAQAQEVNYKAQSLFLYNFIKYSKFPTLPLNNEFVITVLGETPLLAELQAMAKVKKTTEGYPIVIRKANTVNDIGTSQLVYIPDSRSKDLKLAVEKTQGQPVLIIAEREGLAKKGAVINFVTLDDDVLKFELSRKVLENRKLRMAGEIVQLALLVD